MAWGQSGTVVVMAAPHQMLTGFNHNVKHHGKAYHVQTEDSGVENPRIVTHLFVGGNILASKKTVYGELAGAEDLGRIVRELMEDQHKEVLRNLVSGVYDHVDAAYQVRSYQPGQLGAEAAPAPAPAASGEAGAPAEPSPPAAPSAGVPFPPLFDPTVRSAAAGTPGFSFPPLFDPTTPQPAAPSGPQFPFPPLFDPVAQRAAEEAAPFLPEEAVEAIFGDDGLSGKTLDEVILSYLVEDEEKKKP